MIVVRCLSPQ